MITKESLQNISEQIIKGEYDKAFDILLNELDRSSDHFDSLVSLKRQYSVLIDERNKGMINEESFRRDLNRVTSNFLSIIRELEGLLNESAFDNIDLLSNKEFERVITDYVSKGELDKAFNFIRHWIDSKGVPDSEFTNHFVVLFSKFNTVKNDERKGILSIDQIRLENARISDALLRLAQEINSAPKKQIEQKEKQEQIQTSAASFVQESITELSKRENRLKLHANMWYFVGFVSLITGIGIAVFLVKIYEHELQTTVGIVYLILKSLLIIGLLVASSRYAFNLGKTYMNESLKNADRIHAISFGKFYLQVFGTNIKPEDLKDVFKDWNTNQESGFFKLNSNEFDPQLMQSFLKFVELVKGGGNK